MAEMNALGGCGVSTRLTLPTSTNVSDQTHDF